MAPRRPSEEELGRKWDRCFVDTTFKTVGGAVFGSIFSLVFFKRAAWPVTLGIGIGLGAGYSNCRHQFNWHGPHGPPFRRPPWGRPFWAGHGKDGETQPTKPLDSTPVQPAENQELKKGD
ncbi:MICOS complex subunit Mic10-like [Orbicella faveolata]|uniref:MICOS complex subunit Mic10-like n=1 Tax=Orbicella faveolata TaxID=48498 RepID=UPI0009E4A33E|nr:MICOS complex subunit Mic10-like [Orbicella faveolata]